MPLPPSTLEASTGLTALHLAVINNDLLKVRELLASKEHGVDERTTTGATPLMLASLYGRSRIFMYLLFESATMFKQDFQGFTCVDYVKHEDFAKPLLEKYEAIAGQKPRHAGRKKIDKFLRPFACMLKPDLLEEKEEIETIQFEAPLGQALERRVVFHRKVGMLEILEIRRLAAAKWDFDLGLKTCAAVRSSKETAYLAITISGWRGDIGVQPDASSSTKILKNDTYLELIRDFRKVFGYKFNRYMHDCRWTRSTEKDGVWRACHAEKQLAIFVLRKCIAQVLNVRDCSLENISKLKLAIDGETEGLQTEYIIELEHKPCDCCIHFLKLIQQKSGLRFKWVQREWFVEGKRPKPKPKKSLPASQDSEDVEDAMDIVDMDDQNLQLSEVSDTATSATAASIEDDTDDEENDGVLVNRSGPQNRREKRKYEDPTKEGSEVDEADFSSPRQPLEKRIRIIPRKKQKKKTSTLNQPAPSSDTIAADNSSDSAPEITADKVNSPSLTARRHIVPINFEIHIPQTRMEHTLGVRQPFPGVTDFMAQWDASSRNDDRDLNL